MQVSFDVRCDNPQVEPAYRVYINNELMLERDYVLPEGYSHYRFSANVSSDHSDVLIQSLTPGVGFTYTNMEIDHEIQ